MRTPLVVFAIVVGILVLDVRAQAQGEAPEAGFGDKGHFAIGLERIFGYVHISENLSSGGADTTTTNSISLLGTRSDASVYSFPRIAFDGFIAPSVSLGGSLTYFHVAAKSTNIASNNTMSGFVVAPRIGFAARLGQSVWLWPRVGITYVSFSLELAGGSESSSLFAATVEAPLAVALGPQAILQVGPTFDRNLSGSGTFSTNGMVVGPHQDIKETDVGVQANLALYF